MHPTLDEVYNRCYFKVASEFERFQSCPSSRRSTLKQLKKTFARWLDSGALAFMGLQIDTTKYRAV